MLWGHVRSPCQPEESNNRGRGCWHGRLRRSRLAMGGSGFTSERETRTRVEANTSRLTI